MLYNTLNSSAEVQYRSVKRVEDLYEDVIVDGKADKPWKAIVGHSVKSARP